MATDFINEVAQLKTENTVLIVQITPSLHTVTPYGSSCPDFPMKPGVMPYMTPYQATGVINRRRLRTQSKTQ